MKTDAINLVIEPEQLSALLSERDDLIIVDLCQRSVYAQVHVPGAIHVDPSELTLGEQPAPGKLPSEERLNALFSRLGLSADKTVIAYDDEGGGWAGRLIWTLDMIQHKNYAYLNGGIHAWIKSGMPTEQTINNGNTDQDPAQQYKLSALAEQPSVDKDYLLNNLDHSALKIWDARSEEEYLGLRSYAQKAGHIPGAVNYEWTQAMDRNNQLKFRDLKIIREELAALGIIGDSTQEIITHCQTHHRSGYTYLLGKVLGFDNIRAYPGSWAEWGNASDTPVTKD
ncbi:MAG: thiosulfate sulfurtransferase [Gammaproteobacteria bacterium]|nr:MAG: thiosulfate sulfurtransferase [Gammaproteobacteria bacterium]